MLHYANITKPEPHIILVKAEKAEPTVEEFDDYLSRMLEIYRTHHDIVVIYDMTKSKYLKMTFRIKLGKWVREHRELISSKIYGVVFITSPISKIVIQGVYLVQKPFWKYKIVSDADQAYEWAHQLIQENKKNTV